VSVFPHDISKTEAARITKLDTEIFHYESGKSIYFGGQNVKDQGHKAQKRAGVGLDLCTLVSAGF